MRVHRSSCPDLRSRVFWQICWRPRAIGLQSLHPISDATKLYLATGPDLLNSELAWEWSLGLSL